ncbi:hypothetical protein ACROYT_G003482 [Oculina patagonica]
MLNSVKLGDATKIGLVVAEFLLATHRCSKAIDLYKECLFTASLDTANDEQSSSNSMDNKYDVYHTGHRLAISLLGFGLVNEAIEVVQKTLETSKKREDHLGQAICHTIAGKLYRSIGRLEESINNLKQGKDLMKAADNDVGLAVSLNDLGDAYVRLGQYQISNQCYEEALKLYGSSGCKVGQAASLIGMGTVTRDLGNYGKALEHFEESLKINEELQNQEGIGKSHSSLASVYLADEKYHKSIKHSNNGLQIFKSIGDIQGQRSCYANFGGAYSGLGEYDRSIEYYNKALRIARLLGDSPAEARSCHSLGKVYYFLSSYEKSLAYSEESLKICQRIGMRRDEGISYGNLGGVHCALGRYEKSIDCFEKILEISVELKDRQGQETAYCNLGTMYKYLGKYNESLKYLQKGFAICEETCNGQGKGTYMNNFGKVYYELGQFDKAIEHFEYGLEISKNSEDKRQEGICYNSLGKVYYDKLQLNKSMEYYMKSLKICQCIGDRMGEGISYSYLGNVYCAKGQFDESIESHKKALAISQDISDKQGEGACYVNLGSVCYVLGQFQTSLSYQNKGLEIFKELKLPEFKCTAMFNVGFCHATLHHFREARTFLSGCISLHESFRESLEDELKLSLDDKTSSKSFYKELIRLLIFQGNQSTYALLIAEQGRARALVDLISNQYAIKTATNTNIQLNWSDIKSLCLAQGSHFLFMTTLGLHLCCWFVDKRAQVRFWLAPHNMCTTQKRIACNNDPMHLEDRSLSALYKSVPCPEKTGSESSRSFCFQQVGNLRTEEREESQLIPPNLYQNVISPVSGLIEDSEIIIIPEGELFLIPFAAVQDDTGKYLSETVKIRLIPSLTTLKLIQDSPADYHCQTGALIVGDPKVGPVEFKGNIVVLPPLPKAREEAKMVARLLEVSCLVGEQASKEEVLHRIQEVSLVHIAAHGNAERGEIALAPNSSVIGIPQKDDFMLTMKDIAEVGIRAKLVVLSCCHSASGKILTAEGVVGIARAFLGSGARSVLMALWAINDEATKTFMEIFYKCLIHEKMSASEALHQSMKKMRESPDYEDVKYWAPFVLLGDDIRLDLNDET